MRKAHERHQQTINSNIRRKIKIGNLIITKVKGKWTFVMRSRGFLEYKNCIVQNKFNLNSFTNLVRKTIKNWNTVGIPKRR